jgi:8-oxo-dGTP diphosphatase
LPARMRCCSGAVSVGYPATTSVSVCAMTSRLREAVRAVVIDNADRVLLVRFELPDGSLWAMPGGGIDDGETPEAAIRRELHEEVGLRDVELGPAIWRRTHVFPLSATFDGQRETFFLVHAPTMGGAPAFSVEELHAEGLTGSRWWTLAELRAARYERFAPRRLPDLFASLLVERPPDEPIDTGV